MKLSLKFQDDPLVQNQQTQIIAAKLPITILNQPFVSGLTTSTTNSTSDVSFSVSTSFSSGPSLKLAYSPSSSYPFFLSLKSGLGLFGSPCTSPLVFSAKFSLSSSNVLVPTFSLHFKPQFGHFSIHNSVFSNHSSDLSSGYLSNDRVNPNSVLTHSDARGEFTNGFASEGSSVWQEVKLEPFCGKDELNSPKWKGNAENRSNVVSDDSFVLKSNQKNGFLSGFAVMARTIVPVSKRALLKLRWGVNLPGDVDWNWKMPYLTVNKIGIERVEEAKQVKDDDDEKKSKVENAGVNSELSEGICLWMVRDMENLEKDNRELKRHWEELMKVRTPSTSRNHCLEGNDIREESERKEVKNATAHVTDLESELQKAIKAASS